MIKQWYVAHTCFKCLIHVSRPHKQGARLLFQYNWIWNDCSVEYWCFRDNDCFLAAILDLAAILNTCWCLNDVICIFILSLLYNSQLGPIWMQNNWKYSTSFIWRPSWIWRPFWILSDDFSICIQVRLNSPSFEILKYQVSYFWHQNYAGCIIFKNKSCLRAWWSWV